MTTTKRRTPLVSFQTTKVAEAWRKAALAADKELIVFSPFITSNTAEIVLRSPAKAEIHTRFDVHNFASGASSLDTLRALDDAGHQIFHIEGLHAKIVLSKGVFVSVGSQNLTKRGTKNLEITALFDGPEASRDVAELVAPWLAKREPVTREMIDDLSALIGPASKGFEKARKEAEAVKGAFQSVLKQRSAARRSEAQRRSRVAGRRRILGERIEAHQGSQEIEAQVKNVRGVTVTQSLKPLRGVFTGWKVGRKKVQLERLMRYMIILEQTGQLGWARVAHKRISFVSSSRVVMSSKLHLPFQLRGVVPNSVAFRAMRGGDLAETGNLRIRFSIYGVDCSVRAWYAPGHLDVISVSSSDSDSLAREFLEENRSELGKFEEFVTKIVATPFEYRERLSGATAKSFFGSKTVRIRAVLERDNPVLISTPFVSKEHSG